MSKMLRVLGGAVIGFFLPYLVLLAGAMSFYPTWGAMPYETVLTTMVGGAIVGFCIAVWIVFKRT